MMKSGSILIIFFIFFFIANSCRKDQSKLDSRDYPQQIGDIFLRKCVNSGCHNNASAIASAGLNLTTWENLFKGDNAGSTVIPYRSDFSSLVYFVNTHTDLGPINKPTMPFNDESLSREEVITIKNWIDAGAPNKSGQIKFADNPNRKKIYVTNQGCKVVTVIDQETGLPMRYITVVDAVDGNAIPHQVKVSPDGKYWYVVMVGGGYLKRYRTSDDGFDAKINIGVSNWNTMSISNDSQKAFVVDWSANGAVAVCDLVTMTKITAQTYNWFDTPHGAMVSADGLNVYVTATTGNYIFKMDITDPSNYSQIPLTGVGLPLPSSAFNPHEIAFSPDGTKYYVTCQTEKTVRVFNAATDAFITSISIDGEALEMSFSASKNLLFVAVTESSHFAGTNGAVAVIDIMSNTLHATTPYINTGTQPHGVAVDDAKGLVYVANRNVDNSGPAPHHSSVCGGKNGSFVFIDLNTLMLTGKRIELSVDPYSIGVKL